MSKEPAHKKASNHESELHTSEAIYRKLFDSIDEGVCLFERLPLRTDGHRDYRYLAMNTAMQSMFGIPDLSGQSIRDNFPDEVEEWYDDYDRVLETGQPIRFERESVPQGLVLEMFVTRVEDGSGRRLLAVMQDVTKRKRTEQRQAFLLTLTDALRSLGDPVEIQDAVTREALNYFGADRCYYCEIEGGSAIIRRDARRGDLPSVSGTYPLGSFPILKAVINAGRPFVVPDVHTADLVDDSLKQLCIQLQVISFVNVPVIKQGRAIGVFCLVQSEPRNWTSFEVDLVIETADRIWAGVERARAEDNLRRSEESLRLIVESARGYAIFTTDADGMINSWNPGAAQIFGWSEAEILGQNADVLFTPEDRAKGEPQKELETARTQGSAPDVRWHQRKDGSRVFIDGEVRPMRDGQVNGFVKIGRDLTLQRQAEEALRENQEQLQLLNETLEQQVQEKTAEVRQSASDVINAIQRERERISHVLHDDLQQRVYAVQMQLNFLMDGLPVENDAVRQKVPEIKKELTDILEITRDLSIDLSPPILAGEGLTQAIDWLTTRMREQYGLRFEVQADEPFIIPNKDLHVLLFNCVRELLFNVVKHAEASRAIVALERVNHGLQIEVGDNGKGLLEPVAEEGVPEQNDVPRSLGLPSIRHQLSLFGGSLEIHSQPGTGTQVILFVPIVDAQLGI